MSEAVSVVLPAVQMAKPPLMAATAAGFTNTVTPVIEAQPEALVTVTEYAVVLAGLTTMADKLAPVDHR